MPTARIISGSDTPGKKSKALPVKEQIPVYDPNIPEPTSRDDLLKYWIDLSLDERTANKRLWITEGGAKVSRMTDELTCPVLDRAERYEHSPQVLCKEGILGFRGYWEIEYSGWVSIGAVCEGAGRKAIDGPCGLGENEESWGLGWCGSCYQIWSNGKQTDVRDVPRCSTIGLYVDQPAGVLNFYAVEGGKVGEEEGGKEGEEGGKEGGKESAGKKEVRLLQKFTYSHKEKILAGFWLGQKSSCVIAKREDAHV